MIEFFEPLVIVALVGIALIVAVGVGFAALMAMIDRRAED